MRILACLGICLVKKGKGFIMQNYNYEVIEGIPPVDAMLTLRKLAGWRDIDKKSMEKGLANSLYGVVAVLDKEIIGAARVVGDGSTCFYIQDVIVKPEYQKLGIGAVMMTKVMDFISENAYPGTIVGLMSAKGKEGFYEKFGFWKRPNEKFGHGMIQFWEKERVRSFGN